MGLPVRREQPGTRAEGRELLAPTLDDGPRGVQRHGPRLSRLMSMPEDLEDATAEQLEALLPTTTALLTWEEVRSRLKAIVHCFAMCWSYASCRYGPGTSHFESPRAAPGAKGN
jgi:hypothetical protein